MEEEGEDEDNSLSQSSEFQRTLFYIWLAEIKAVSRPSQRSSYLDIMIWTIQV